MTLKAVRDVLYDITAMFFNGATVIWAEQSNPQPQLPYITIKTGSPTKTAFPICEEDGTRYYPCGIPFEVNLCTNGEKVVFGENVTENYANTSVSDMLDFVMFLESDTMVDYIVEKGIEISLIPPVRDLSELLNDNSSYRFRSMAEFAVTFNGDATGPYGLGGASLPNSSGGGTMEMASAEGSAFVETEITEGGKNNDEE